MDAVIAVHKASIIAKQIQNSLKPELANLITDEQLTVEYWMDRISPKAWFATERELIGLVYSVLITTTANKEREPEALQVSVSSETLQVSMPEGLFELRVSYHRKSVSGMKFTNSETVVEYARKEIYPNGTIQYVEQFYVLLLDRKNQLFAYKQISNGGVSATFTDPKLIFQTALLCHATQLILVHNHPSGNIEPSKNDIQLTKRLKTLGDLLDLLILDHIIIAQDNYYSFADEGVM